MATLTKQTPSLTGTAITYGAAAGGGDALPYSARAILLVKNTDGSSHTVTVAVPGNTEYGQAQPDIAVAVAAGVEKAIGPFPRGIADDNGLVQLTYSAATGMVLAYVGI